MRMLKAKGAKRHWQGHSDPARAGFQAVTPAPAPLLWTPDWPIQLPRAPWGWPMCCSDPAWLPPRICSSCVPHLLTATSFSGQKSKSPPWYLQLHTPYSAHLESSYVYLYNLSWTWTLLTNLVHARSAAVTSFWSPSLLSLWPLTGHFEQPSISSEHKSDNIIFLA